MLPVFVSAQDVASGQELRCESPAHSSSAPSTASYDPKEPTREVGESYLFILNMLL